MYRAEVRSQAMLCSDEEHQERLDQEHLGHLEHLDSRDQDFSLQVKKVVEGGSVGLWILTVSGHGSP